MIVASITATAMIHLFEAPGWNCGAELSVGAAAMAGESR
jgi:hypothetical protein